MVIGLPVHATWQALWTEVPRTWEEFVGRRAEVDDAIGETFIDVSLDQTGDEYLQLVGLEVSRVDCIPAEMLAVEIPAQRYVFHKHIGPTSEIAGTFGRMYDWARQHDHDAGQFKIDIGYTVAGDEREHDLFIGLRPEKMWREMRAA